MALTLDAAPTAPARDEPRFAWWSPRSWSHGDRRAVAMLAAVPVLVFVLPALAGHAAVVGDNLLQNYPLRVLTGRQLDAGHLPVWNPYAFSGTPLLGGMNAGSAYPGTLLFAVVPGVVAWVANLLVVYWSAALGLFALARWLGAGTLAAGLAAATYAFSGAMVGQLVHIGVVQGQGLLPWLVLGQLALGRAVLASSSERWRDVTRRALPATTGIAVVVGLVCLTGEPRSIVDAEVVVAVVGLVELLCHGQVALATARGRVAYVAATAVAVCWGLALALVQLAPGWGFVTLSERHQVSYAFFAQGSWPAQWLPLLFVQGLLGDNGVLGTPTYFAGYNLAEVTGAVGLLAITAVAAALAQLCSRTAVASRRRLAPFVALALVGVVFALGSYTPLGPLLHEVPLLGRTRLQNRSMVLFDLAATVLLAWWLDAVLAGRRDEASLTGRRRAVTLAPLVATVALCALALVDPAFVTVTLLRASGTAAASSGIRWLVVVSLVVAGAYLALLWRRPRRRVAASRALVAVLLLELLCFNVFFQSALISGVSTFSPAPPHARAAFGTLGRTAFMDPGVFGYHQTVPLGLANLGVFTRLPSVQGYGSLESQRYADATGTSRLGSLDGCALARGAFAPLRLAAIAVTSSGLVVSRVRDAEASTCGPVLRRASVTRFFGARRRVAWVAFSAPRGTSLRARDARVVALAGDGEALAARAVLSVRDGRLVATFASHPLAAAVRLSAPGGVEVATTTLHSTTGRPALLDTAMQVALDRPAWHLVEVLGRLAIFRATHVDPPVWLANGARGATARLVASNEDGSATVVVSSPSRARLVRSEAWLPGWEATLSRSDGADARTLAVVPDGLVQSVAVPPGEWRVTFAYRAPHLRAGETGSALALLGVLGALATMAVWRRRGHGALRPVR